MQTTESQLGVIRTLQRPLPAALVALTVVGMYMATALNAPIVFDYVADVLPDGDYRCAGHGCGCQSAEQCQTSCCCFPKEKPPCPVTDTASSCCDANSANDTPRVVFKGCTGPPAVPPLNLLRLAPHSVADTDMTLPGSDDAGYGISSIRELSSADGDRAGPVPRQLHS
jgi:hypothetical protein